MGNLVTPYRQPLTLTAQPVQPLELTPQQPAQVQVGGIDLRAQFNNFIEPYGQMVIVQRLNLHLHCTNCWNEKLGEGDPRCPYCLGRGYQSVLERHVSRRVSALMQTHLELLEQSGPGDEMIDQVFWFFEWNVNVQEADVIYEVTWTDASMTLVDKLLEAYQITYAYPFRGAGGRIEYWRTSSKSKPIDRDLVGQHLRRLASQTMQIPVDGALYGDRPRKEG